MAAWVVYDEPLQWPSALFDEEFAVYPMAIFFEKEGARKTLKTYAKRGTKDLKVVRCEITLNL